jgi:hypothetical protein
VEDLIMTARRGFLKNLGLFGVAVAGASAASAADSVKPAETVGEKIDHLAPTGEQANISLTRNNKEQDPFIFDSGHLGIGTSSPMSQLYVAPVIEPNDINRVEMSVGKDNRLWIKVDGLWKRVVVE